MSVVSPIYSIGLIHNFRGSDAGSTNVDLMSRYFCGANTPVVNYNGGSGNIWDHQIALNLGNLAGEKAWRQKPFVITTALVICSGLTCWLLEIVRADWCVIFTLGFRLFILERVLGTAT